MDPTRDEGTFWDMAYYAIAAMVMGLPGIILFIVLWILETM